MPRRSPIALIVLGSCLWACSLAYPVDVTGGSLPESKPAEGDAGGTDAVTPDAQSSDGETGTTTRFCATAAASKLCDDFDDGDLGAKWSGSQIFAGGELGFSSVAQSAPRSLLSASGGDAGMGMAANLYRTFAVRSGRDFVDFDLDLAALDSNGGHASILGLQFGNGPRPSRLLLRLSSENAIPNATLVQQFDNGGSAGEIERPLTVGPRFWGWTHVRIELDLFAGEVQVLFDTQSVLTDTTLAASFDGSNSVTLSMGIQDSTNTPPPVARFYVDNVVFDYDAAP